MFEKGEFWTESQGTEDLAVTGSHDSPVIIDELSVDDLWLLPYFTRQIMTCLLVQRWDHQKTATNCGIPVRAVQEHVDRAQIAFRELASIRCQH
jgi:hypothetical protein